MSDEFTIRATARSLQHLYALLDELKHSGGLRREARVQRPAHIAYCNLVKGHAGEHFSVTTGTSWRAADDCK